MFLSKVSVSDDFHGPLCCNTFEPSPCLYTCKEFLSHFTRELLSDSLFESIACGQETNKLAKEVLSAHSILIVII